MQTEDRIKNLFEVLKRIDTYLVSTNQKVAIIISYCAAVLGWLSLNVGKITGLVTHGWIRPASRFLWRPRFCFRSQTARWNGKWMTR